MPEPIFQRIVDSFAPASSAELIYELPQYSLSYLNLSVIRTQPTANTSLSPSDMVGWLSRVVVYVRGVTIIDLTGEELMVVGSVLYSKQLAFRKTTHDATTSRHILNLFVPFSRKPLMPNSGLKPSERGTILLYLRTGTVPAGTLLSIHAIGWRENAPEWCVRCVRTAVSITTTGENDVILSPAGAILGFGFHETNPMLSVGEAVLRSFRLLIQGVEDTIYQLNYEALVGEYFNIASVVPSQVEHQHIENIAATYTQNALSLTYQIPAPLNRYAFLLLDEYFDPDTVIAVPPGLDTRLRITSTATGTLTIFPIEMFTPPERERAAA